MSVKVVSRKYNEIYNSGETDWLLGNVGEWQELELDLEVTVSFYATQQESVTYDPIIDAFILNNGKSWFDYGFQIGTNVTLDFVFGGAGNIQIPVSLTHQIVNIYGSTMEISGSLQLVDSNMLPYDRGETSVSEVVFYSVERPEGCSIVYSHLTNENFESQNLTSFIDASTTKFVRPLIPSTTTLASMEPVGIQSGMSVRDVFVQYQGSLFQDGVPKHRYKMRLKFMISSFFEDVSDIEDQTIPDFLAGNGSLTDNFLIEFYPRWNNPNIAIRNELHQTQLLGNTGWFNENFNELDNDFSLEELQYFDQDGNQVDSIDYSARTKATGKIKGITNFDNDLELGFGFAWIPVDEVDYKNKETPFYRNLFIQSGDINDGFSLNTLYPGVFSGAGLDGGSMNTENVKFTRVGNDVVFEVEFVPNASFFNIFDSKNEDDRNYLFWISVGDGGLLRNFSNRVSLIADYDTLIKTIPFGGVYDLIDNKFIEHPFESDNPGVETYKGIVQDDILCRLPFRIPTDGRRFQKMTFGVEAFSPSTTNAFELQKYEVDLTSYPIDGSGIQQFNFDALRGFKMNPGNNKNIVQIKRSPGLDGINVSGYLAYYSFKIRYEDWIQNQDAPGVFFDDTELNDGLNNDWFGYLQANGYILNVFVEIISEEEGELIEYKNQFPFTFKDYDQNENVEVTQKYLRDSDNTDLTIGTDPETGKTLGVILSNEPTRIEHEFEILDSGVWDISKTYAVTTIEIDKGAGQFEERRLSSVWGSESDNPLIPLSGETKLKIEVDGTNKILKTSCLVDPDLLSGAIRYRITGRVGCYDVDGNVFDEGLYEFRYQTQYE